jgi:hypothetical protein
MGVSDLQSLYVCAVYALSLLPPMVSDGVRVHTIYLPTNNKLFSA